MKISEKKEEVKKDTEDLEASFYYALSHEIRRKIIMIIGDNDFSSFTQLKKEIGVSTGTIYHHLDTLATLIEQRKTKKYQLTDLGIHAYNSLKENIKTIEKPGASKELNSPLLKGLMALTPKNYFSFKEDEQTYVLIVSLVILILGAIFAGLNGYYSFFLFFRDATENLEELPIYLHILLSLAFIINFLIFFFVVELLCRIMYGKKDKTKEFFLSFSITFFPMVIYLALHFFFLSMGLMSISYINILDLILMIFFQVWSLWLLTYNLNQNKELRLENGLIISLMLHYGGFIIILFMSI